MNALEIAELNRAIKHTKKDVSFIAKRIVKNRLLKKLGLGSITNSTGPR